MSIQAALEFLQAIRHAPDLQAALVGVRDSEQLARTATDAGFACSAGEIVRAFGIECGFRRAAYLTPTSESNETTGDLQC